MSAKLIVFKNTSAQIITKAISAIVALTITFIVAQQLGVFGYGEFTKITAYVSLFYLLADFGLNAVFVAQASSSKVVFKKQIGSFFLLRIVFSLLLVGILIGLLFLIPAGRASGFTPLVQIGIVVFSISVIAQAVITTCNAVFQKKLSYHFSTIAVFIGAAISLFLVLGLAFGNFINTKAGALWVVTVLAFGTSVTAISAAYFVKRITDSFSLAYDGMFIKTLVKKGYLLGLALFASVSISHSGRLILTIFRSTSEVGIYGLAYKFFEFPLAIPTFFMNSVFPLFVADYKKDRPRLFRRIQYSFILLLSSSIVFSVVLYFIAPLIMVIKEEFIESVSIFRLLVSFLPLFFLSSLTMWLMILQEAQGLLFLIYAAFAVLNIGASFILIPMFGAAAAVLLVGITEAGILLTSIGVLYFLFKKNSN